LRNEIESGATAVITHRIQTGFESQYENWLREIGPICRSSKGILDWQIIRPIPGMTFTYTIVIRYDSHENLHAWMNSKERKDLIEKVHSILATGDDFYINSGLDFWFTPEGAKATVPVRWKQFLITWSAIFPLVLVTPLVLLPPLRLVSVPQNEYFEALLVSGVVVFLMIYVVMPHYTRMVKDWLFKQ
jgi:uncharacterized protein